MSLGRSMSSNLAPLLLRLAVGVLFLHAGWGKVLVKMEYQPEQLAVLANMGFGGAKDAALGGGGPVEARPLDEAKPADDPADALPEPQSRTANGGHIVLARQKSAPAEAAPAPTMTITARVYRATDFEQPVKLLMLHNVGLALHDAAHPEDGKRALLPKAMVERPWGWSLSWAAALTEFVGGIFLIVGFLTRLSAFGIAVVMGMALWLTSIGPNLGASGAFLGILPAVGFMGEWNMWLQQFTLFCAAMAIFLIGPGAVSIDGFVFGRRKRGGAAEEADEEDEE